DRLLDALLIGADYRTQILWVERGRERGRANEVGEHHRQLATLGVVSPSWLDIQGCRRCRYGSRDVAEIPDRTPHLQPMAERNAKVFEMLIGQVRENGHINVVLGKSLRVLGHAELFEPVGNLLHRSRLGGFALSAVDRQHQVYHARRLFTAPAAKLHVRSGSILLKKAAVA